MPPADCRIHSRLDVRRFAARQSLSLMAPSSAGSATAGFPMVGELDRPRNRCLAKLIGMPERSEDGAGHLSIAKGSRRYFYLVLAGMFFVLASVGVLLPGIPTTPFVLLTSYFLIRSSPFLNRRLMQSKVFGAMLRDWHRHRALKPRVKTVSLLACSSVILLSVFFGGMPAAARAVVVAAGICGIWFVWRLPVIRNTPGPDRIGTGSR